MIQFNDKKLEEVIGSRAGRADLSPSLTAKRDLERYYQVLSESMPPLTRGEAMLICDVCNGWAAWDNPSSPDYLWVEVEDGIRIDGLDKKWGVAEDFGARLRALPITARYALVDAAERYWCASDDNGRHVSDFFSLTEKPNPKPRAPVAGP